MRGALKLKQAMEFCRWGGSKITFKALFDAEELTRDDHGFHVYRAMDIRKARIALSGLDEEPARPKTLPPIVYCRTAKGGVGKTTITGNVAACLAMQGYKVLMIDADPQASLTSLFGIDWAQEPITHIGHLLQLQGDPRNKLTDAALEAAIRPIYEGGMLDLIASDITLTHIDTWLLQQSYAREKLVHELLEDHIGIFSRYDVILIDGAPGTSQMSFAMMYAAKNLLAVVSLDGQSIKAMEVLSTNVSDIKRAYPGEDFNVRIVANGYVSGVKTCAESIETLRRYYPGRVDPNIIPHAASFMRQVSLADDSHSAPVIEKEPSSTAAKAIMDLSQSLVGTYDIHMAGTLPIVVTRKSGPKKKPQPEALP